MSKNTMTVKEISDILKSIDICMMTTRSSDGSLESRPMSNNKDVDYHGDSYFFTLADTRVVKDLTRSPNVCLAYDGRTGLLGKHYYISIAGEGELITDKATMKRHWVPDLDAWFKDGIDTEGLTMIKVHAHHIRYWQGMEEGEITLKAGRKAA
jgi:general stress protein 26